MIRHALKGVTDGRAKCGAPVEIMGLLTGKLQRGSLVVTDVMPLPVEGIEYQVTAKDDALALAARMADLMEERRNDRFIGWYHSHPFDVAAWSHCHLSATDCQTQAQWQFMTPWWIALVVDPLRSLVQQAPEIGVYRCYPPELTPTTTPDGTPLADAPLNQVVRRWGNSHHRYYQLNHTYFTSGPSARLYNTASASALWRVALTASPGGAPMAAAEAAGALQNLADRVAALRGATGPADSVSVSLLAALCSRARIKKQIIADHAAAPGALLTYVLACLACTKSEALASRAGMETAAALVAALPEDKSPVRDAVACAKAWLAATDDAADVLLRLHVLNQPSTTEAMRSSGENTGNVLDCLGDAHEHTREHNHASLDFGCQSLSGGAIDQDIEKWQEKYNCCTNNGFMKQLMLAVTQRSQEAADFHTSIQITNQ